MCELADYAVELRNVSKRFPGPSGEIVAAVKNVNMQIGDGEFFSMLGPSGCGKTTSLRMIAGFEHPTEGEVYIHGRAMGRTPAFQRPVNTVFQSYALFPHMTIGAFGLQMDGVAKADIMPRVKEALTMVRLPGYENRKPKQLSGGQQQRVALARALVKRPEVLLLDEPLGALDLKLRKEMQLELKRLQREVGITFVYVTHDQEEALTMSDRIAVMRDGRIEQTGTPREVYDRPATEFVARFIGRCNVVEGRAGTFNGRTVEVETSPLGRIRAHAAEAPAMGSRVSVAVRPEAIMLAAGGSELTVEDAVFAGGSVRLDLRAADGSRIEAESPRGVPVPASGERLRVCVPDLAATVLAPIP